MFALYISLRFIVLLLVGVIKENMIRSRAQRKKRQRVTVAMTGATSVPRVSSLPLIDRSRMFWLNDLDELKHTLRTSGCDRQYFLHAAEAGSELLLDHLFQCMKQNDIPDFDQYFKDHVCRILLLNGAQHQRYNDCLFKWFFQGLEFKPWMVEYAQAHQNENGRRLIETFLLPSIS